MDSIYKGPTIIESYLMKKKIKNQGNKQEKTILRYFKFNVIEKSFIYKDDKDSKEIKMIYTGKDLKLFIDSVDQSDRNLCKFPYGFQVITSGKNFVLFAQNKEIYNDWIRIFYYHFNKIDISDPASAHQINSYDINHKSKINNYQIKNNK